MTLQEFIDNYMQLSQFRGLDPLNPVDFKIQPDPLINKTWMLVCSYSEPTFARIPYNVLWIPMESTDENFGKVLRRIDHETTSFSYRSNWEVVPDYDSLWIPDQYYMPVVEDLALYGIGSPNENLPAASPTVLGIMRLAPNPDEIPIPVTAVGIETEDPRMSDDRYPNFHTHPDYARSLIKINDTQWARVNLSFPPQEGMMLFLDSINPAEPNEFIAVWRYPKESSIVLVDRSLVYIEIRGDTTMLEQTNKPYEVWGVFADGESRQVTPNTWTVTVNPAAASLNPSTGILTAADIMTSTTIRMNASYTEKGITRTAFLDVQIIAAANLESLEIVGPEDVLSGTSTPYQVVAGFDDGSFVNVTPATFTTSNTAITETDVSKVLIVDQIFVDDVTTLEATYTFGGITLSATKVVTLIREIPKPALLEILGPNAISEFQSETYTFLVTYQDGSQDTKLSVTSFIKQSGPAALTVTGSVASVGAMSGNAPAVLYATYTEGGVTITDFHNINIVDLNLPASLVVREDTIGAAMNPAESGTINSGAWFLMEDGAITDPSVVEPSTDVSWTVAPGTHVTVDNTYRNDILPLAELKATEAQMTARWPYVRRATLTATKVVPSKAGQTLTGTRDVYIDPPRLVAVKLVPQGQDPATYVMPTDATVLEYNENSTFNVGIWFQIEETHQLPTPGTVTKWIQHAPQTAPTVPAEWGGLNAFERTLTVGGVTTPIPAGSSTTNLPGTIAATASPVAADTAGFIRLNIKHNYTDSNLANPGTTDITVELPFTVKDVAAVPTALRIRVQGGPNANSSTHNEETDLDLYYEAQFSDAPTVWVNVSNHPGLVAALGATTHGSVLAANNTDLTLGSVTGNQALLVTASITNGGATVNATNYTITILDTTAYINTLRVRLANNPNAAGSASNENENQTLGLVYLVDYTNAVGTFVEINPVTAGAALGVTLGTPNGAVLQNTNTQIVLPDVTGNKTVSINATYTENGVTKNGTYTITILDQTVYLNSIRVRLSKAPNAASNSSTENESQSLGLVYQADYTNAVGTWVNIDPADTDLTVTLGTPTNGATLTGKTAVNLPDVTGQQTVVINASYVENGVTRAGSYTITVTDQTIYLNAFRIRLASAPTASTNTSTHNENQTIPIVYQAQYSNAPTTWVDVTADAAVTGAVVAPANGVSLLTKSQVVLPDVASNVSTTVRGSYTYNGNTVTADYIFNITNVVITPLELRIRLASNPSAGTNTSTHDESQTLTMIYQARFSDAVGTWVNVNNNPGLTASVVAPTNGVTMDAAKTGITLPDVTGNQTTNLTASLTQNGSTVNATYVINITDTTPPPAGPTPRWGVAPRQNLQADYADPAFYNLLTNPLTLVNGELFGPVVGDGTQNKYGYLLYPASMGFLYIVSTTGTAGAWDGGSTTYNDSQNQAACPVTINGVAYYVYRQTFPVNGSRSYNVTYGSSAMGSGTP